MVGTAVAAVFALGFAGNAAADGFITGKDVKNNSLSGADIKNGTIGSADIKNGSIRGRDIKTNTITWRDIANGTVRSTEIKNGTIQLKDMSNKALNELTAGILDVLDVLGVFDDLAAVQGDVTSIRADLTALAGRVTAAEGTLNDVVAQAADIDLRLGALEGRVSALEANQLVNSNWGNILRNVMGAGTTQLRNGPYATNFGLNTAPPAGTGSLEINTANGDSKIAFGNEVDFVGDAVSDIGSPSFWVYTTGENAGKGANNLPNIALEIDPDVNAGNGDAINYTTMVFVPQGAANLGGWTQYTATDGVWYFTGGAGTATGCSLGTPCTFEAAMDALGDNATIHSVAVSKGRDAEFHGAVDALQIGGVTYDFEARGVVESTPLAKAAKKK
jgi:hypothetical protein